jgi:Cys-tRNA(Pro)/Cys-tRNA(Cys) deacylase
VITNNVTRFLDAKKVAYETFEIPTEKLSALEVAEILKVPPESVYKTIVAKRGGPGKPILAIVPGPLEVDLKKLAAAVKEKKVFITAMHEAEEMTGLQAGGISALALINKGFQVVIDASAQTLDVVMVSAGQRGLQVRLAPGDLARLVNGRFADVASST